MLLQLKSYLKEKGIVSLEELAAYLDEDPNVIQDMLEHFIRKGQVVKKVSSDRCDTCTMHCGIDLLAVYEWKDFQKGKVSHEQK
jgi:putative ferrous iron transport protein C